MLPHREFLPYHGMLNTDRKDPYEEERLRLQAEREKWEQARQETPIGPLRMHQKSFDWSDYPDPSTLTKVSTFEPNRKTISGMQLVPEVAKSMGKLALTPQIATRPDLMLSELDRIATGYMPETRDAIVKGLEKSTPFQLKARQEELALKGLDKARDILPTFKPIRDEQDRLEAKQAERERLEQLELQSMKQKALSGTGQFLGETALWGAGYGLAGARIGGALGTRVSPLVKEGIRGASVGALVSPIESVAKEHDLKEGVKNALFNIGLGAIGDPAIMKLSDMFIASLKAGTKKEAMRLLEKQIDIELEALYKHETEGLHPDIKKNLENELTLLLEAPPEHLSLPEPSQADLDADLRRRIAERLPEQRTRELPFTRNEVNEAGQKLLPEPSVNFTLQEQLGQMGTQTQQDMTLAGLRGQLPDTASRTLPFRREQPINEVRQRLLPEPSSQFSMRGEEGYGGTSSLSKINEARVRETLAGREVFGDVPFQSHFRQSTDLPTPRFDIRETPLSFSKQVQSVFPDDPRASIEYADTGILPLQKYGQSFSQQADLPRPKFELGEDPLLFSKQIQSAFPDDVRASAEYAETGILPLQEYKKPFSQKADIPEPSIKPTEKVMTEDGKLKYVEKEFIQDGKKVVEKVPELAPELQEAVSKIEAEHRPPEAMRTIEQEPITKPENKITPRENIPLEVPENMTYNTNEGKVSANKYIYENKPRIRVEVTKGVEIGNTGIKARKLSVKFDNMTLKHFTKLAKDAYHDSKHDIGKAVGTPNFVRWIQNPFKIYRDILGDKNIFAEQTTNLFYKTAIDGFHDSKAAMVEIKNYIGEEVKTMMNLFNIDSVGGDKSAMIQAYGEGKLNLTDIQELRPDDWQDIVNADAYFRYVYDNLIDILNDAVTQIYQHDPKTLAEKLVRKRKDYYRHSMDLGKESYDIVHLMEDNKGFARKVKGVARGQVSKVKKTFGGTTISPEVAGISPELNPRAKWSSIQQQRTGDETVYSALEGLLQYTDMFAYDVTISPFINMNDALINTIRDMGKGASKKESRRYNSALTTLVDMNKILQGKQVGLDALVANLDTSRVTTNLIRELNARMRANQVLGKLTTIVAQATHLPQALAVSGPVNLAKGFARMIPHMLDNPKMYGLDYVDPMEMSTFAKERFGSNDWIKQFDNTYEKILGGVAEVTAGMPDEFFGKIAWYSFYDKAVKEGITNPTRYADDMAREILGARGVGEKSILQSQQMTNQFMPFALEQTNNFVNTGLMLVHNPMMWGRLMIGNYLFNLATDEAINRKYQIDPIGAVIQALHEGEKYANVEDKAGMIAGHLAGEVFSQMPLIGQSLAAMTPSDTRRKYMGDRDPMRYGNVGLYTLAPFQGDAQTLGEKATNIAASTLLPMGGQQIVQTARGAKAVSQGYFAGEGLHDVLTEAVNGPKEENDKKIRFMMDGDMKNTIKAVTVGIWSTDAAKKYLDREIQPMSVNQSTRIMSSPNPQAEYDAILQERLDKYSNDLIDEIDNDPYLSIYEKNAYIEQVQKAFDRGERYPKTLLPLGGK